MDKSRKRLLDIPGSQRPRERLSQFGVANLTDAELVAILLGVGTKKQHVVSLARRLLKIIPLDRLSQATVPQLSLMHGIGSVQAGKILAAVELGRRLFREQSIKTCLSPSDVQREVRDIADKLQENLVGLYLNARYELLAKHTIGIGTVKHTSVEPRDVLRHAIVLPSPFLILVHNHPSGVVTPSSDDLKVTKIMVKAGSLLGVQVVDHLIVSGSKYFSFREAKLL
jgi:DNA repair protein RadC